MCDDNYFDDESLEMEETLDDFSRITRSLVKNVITLPKAAHHNIAIFDLNEAEIID